MRASYCHCRMCLPWHEITRVNCATRLCRSKHRKFWSDRFAHISHAHRQTSGEPNRFHLCHETFIRFELLNGLISRKIKGIGARSNRWHCHIHTGHFDIVKLIAKITRWQQFTSSRTNNIHKLKVNPRGGSWHAINCGIAIIAHDTTRRLHPCHNQSACIDKLDPHFSNWISGWHKPHFNCRWANTR